MNTQQLTYVIAVADCQSFSKAAEKLYVTQPSLSQYIHSIEKQLGVQLFDRSSSPIRLTDAGKLYVSWARRLLTMEEDMNNALSDLMGMQTGSVRIGASSFRVRCLLARSIAEYHEQHPGIHLSIEEADMRQLRELLGAAAAPHRVEWTWVKGHAGHPDNERADKLASDAAHVARPSR